MHNQKGKWWENPFIFHINVEMWQLTDLSDGFKKTLSNLPKKSDDVTTQGLEHHRRDHISLIFQSYNLIDYMTPIENVRLTAKLDTAPILERLGLTKDETQRNVLKLPGGQQRGAIARALSSDAPVILADEPTGVCGVAGNTRQN